MSFISLTDRSVGPNAGSTVTLASAPSPIAQKMQKRLNSL